MNAVILFSHGSLLCGAGEALKEQARRLEAQEVASTVRIGYLNYSEPLFATTVAEVVAAGATRIIVAPYFLVPGKFVRVDLPKAVEAALQSHPGVEFVVAEAIGFDERLADALRENYLDAFGHVHWRDDLRQATTHCRPNPECPLYGTTICPKAPGDKQVTESFTARALEEVVVERESVVSTPKDAMLVMVHGSPRPIANEDMFRVVEILRQRMDTIIEVGFMECNEPDIPIAIDRCVEQGATSITAVPYFLHTGTHVADDLPTLMEAGQERHPDVSFLMAPYLGRSERLTKILIDRIRATGKLE